MTAVGIGSTHIAVLVDFGITLATNLGTKTRRRTGGGSVDWARVGAVARFGDWGWFRGIAWLYETLITTQIGPYPVPFVYRHARRVFAKIFWL